MPPSSRLARLVIAAALTAAACAGADPELTDVESSRATDPPTASTSDGHEPAVVVEPSTAPSPTTSAAPPTSTPEPTPSTAPTETPTASPTAPPEPDPTTTPELDPTATPRSAEDPTPAPGQPCISGLSGDPAVTTTATADLDGDGAADQVTAYAVDNGPRTWFIRVDTAAGESLDSPLEVAVAESTLVTPIGGADVDGDGTTRELFTVVGAGAATTIVTILTRVGCELVQVTLDQTPAAFPVGGSVVNLAGLQCLDTDGNGVNNTIVAWTGVADPGAAVGTYDMTGVEYRLRGTELTLVGERSVRANLSEADFAYAQLSCEGVSL